MGKTLSKKIPEATLGKVTSKTLPKALPSQKAETAISGNDPEVTNQVNKIMSALNEAKEIHTGRKKGKTYDDFLKEI